MKECIICHRNKAYGRYTFCPECYHTFKEEIHTNQPWVAEMKRFYWRARRREEQRRYREVYLLDKNLVVGNDGKVYMRGVFENEYN